MGTGAVIGAGVGTMVSAATPGPSVTIPAESQMDFYLASPISVVPVSAKDAAQLAQGYHHGGPVLYVRGDTPYGQRALISTSDVSTAPFDLLFCKLSHSDATA
jgi:hypothetical protein